MQIAPTLSDFVTCGLWIFVGEEWCHRRRYRDSHNIEHESLAFDHREAIGVEGLETGSQVLRQGT